MEEQRRARPGIPFGRVAGVPVFLTGSWLVLAVGLVFAYGTYVQVRLPAPLGYLVGAGLVAGLTASVLLHELGHAFVARHLGMGVRGITLNLRGGYTELAGEAPSPRVELAVSLLRQGVRDYLIKPVTKEELLTVIRRSVDQHVVLRDQFAV